MIDIEELRVHFESIPTTRKYTRLKFEGYGDYEDSVVQAKWEGFLAHAELCASFVTFLGIHSSNEFTIENAYKAYVTVMQPDPNGEQQ